MCKLLYNNANGLKHYDPTTSWVIKILFVIEAVIIMNLLIKFYGHGIINSNNVTTTHLTDYFARLVVVPTCGGSRNLFNYE